MAINHNFTMSVHQQQAKFYGIKNLFFGTHSIENSNIEVEADNESIPSNPKDIPYRILEKRKFISIKLKQFEMLSGQISFIFLSIRRLCVSLKAQ
jgi:hypothetical protein